MMATSAAKPTAQAGGQSEAQQAKKELAPNSFYPSATNPSTAGNGFAAKPPLPPKRPASAPRSDVSGFSEPEDDVSDLSVVADDLPDDGSDYSDSGDSHGRRKRKRNRANDEQIKRARTPVDTDMRRKLRGNTPPGESRGPSLSHVSETEYGGSDLEDDPAAVQDRVVTAEEETAQKAALKTNWELAAVLDFLAMFEPYMGGQPNLQFSVEELESALIFHTGVGGPLVDLHMGLLKGISPRGNVTEANWTNFFAEKLKAYWRMSWLPGKPPFAPAKGCGAAEYAQLPLEKRVSALKLLCEMRLDREDLHNVVEVALHPPRKSKAAKKAEMAALANGKKPEPEPRMPTMAEMRKEPLGKDSSGLLYWYLDYPNTTGTRLYRETPQHLAKSKERASELQWELLGSSLEEFTEVGEKLKRSKKKSDQALASLLLEVIVVELLERREADLRKQRTAARMRQQLSSIIPEDGGSRPRRARKEVNYSFDAYDAQIKDALRVGRSGREEHEGRTRRSAFDQPRLTAEEEAMRGLRRGRSAIGAEPALMELPMPPPRSRGRGGESDADHDEGVDADPVGFTGSADPIGFSGSADSKPLPSTDATLQPSEGYYEEDRPVYEEEEELGEEGEPVEEEEDEEPSPTPDDDRDLDWGGERRRRTRPGWRPPSVHEDSVDISELGSQDGYQGEELGAEDDMLSKPSDVDEAWQEGNGRGEEY